MIVLSEILKRIGNAHFIGNDSALINDVIQLDTNNKRNDVIYWCNDKNIDALVLCQAGTIICSDKIKQTNYINKNCNYIIVAKPRAVFVQVLKDFFIPIEDRHSISLKSSIHSTAKIGKNVFIGDNTVIEKDCVIGDDTYIGHNNTILFKTNIGNKVRIGNNNTIGGIGFGYEKDEHGIYEIVPHIGNVIIKDKVEIGNNTCIDRAVIGSTILNENVKVDNLVHLAHGVVIGENSLIIAHAMIGGSTEIGKNVWVSPGALVINKTKIENNSLIGMGAVVVRKVDENTIVVGNPAKFLKNI